jgi:hypothetical protein
MRQEIDPATAEYLSARISTLLSRPLTVPLLLEDARFVSIINGTMSPIQPISGTIGTIDVKSGTRCIRVTLSLTVNEELKQ